MPQAKTKHPPGSKVEIRPRNDGWIEVIVHEPKRVGIDCDGEKAHNTYAPRADRSVNSDTSDPET